MTEWFLRYKPQEGYLHNWLVAGPQQFPIHDIVGAAKLDRQTLAAHFGQFDATIQDAPCELAKFTLPGQAGAAVQFTWRYRRCAEDHLVDLAEPYPDQHYVRAWAYTEVVSPVGQRLRLTLDTFGAAQLWLNDEVVINEAHADGDALHNVAAEVKLVKGVNRILVRIETLQLGATPFGFALRVGDGTQRRLQVQMPTLNAKTERHQALEEVAQAAYLEHDLYAGTEALHVKWPDTLRTERPLMLRVQKPTGQIVGEAQPVVKAGFSQHLLEGKWAKDGRYLVKVLPELDDHVRGLRVGQDIEVNILHDTYVNSPKGDPAERAVEFLKHAAWWSDGIYAELASMTLGLWKQVNQRAILRIFDQAVARQGSYEETLMGMVLMAIRYTADPAMPPALVQHLEKCLLAFDYEADSSSVDAQGLADDVAILRHAYRMLAGQFYPDRPFVSSQQLGRWHQEVGEQRALAWLARRAQGGFAAWDSGEGFAAMILALVALTDYADSTLLSDLAAATLDKLLFGVALNSFQGTFGSTHGATSAASITDGRMEPMSPISRLLWGIGCWNQHTAGCFALATSQAYGCPPLHAAIALDQPSALLARERHITAWRTTDSGVVATQEVNKVTFKTPDAMLSSAQDYRPGEAGAFEHIWQATLSPSAVVFVNHPRWMNQKDAYPANFWRGNGVLPRVAQWHDLLIAIHRLPADDPLGYTHAHFPVAAFDQVAFRRGWAFARKGDGYVAITASKGIKLVKNGAGAFRELRSVAQNAVWLCQIGRVAQDGSFADFQKAILSQPVTYEGLGVRFVSLRGDTIAFDWSGPLMVQGTAQPLSGFPHYESPYATCELGASEMNIHFADSELRLDFDMSPDPLPTP